MSVGDKPVHKGIHPLHTPVVCPPTLCGYPIQSGAEIRQELLFGAAVFTSFRVVTVEKQGKHWEASVKN